MDNTDDDEGSDDDYPALKKTNRTKIAKAAKDVPKKAPKTIAKKEERKERKKQKEQKKEKRVGRGAKKNSLLSKIFGLCEK